MKQHIRTQDILESAKEIILVSWRTTTKNRYNTTYWKWQEFYSERNINSIQPIVNNVISFFSLLYNQGQGYQSNCNARSAVNNKIYIPEFSDILQHPLIKRFIKGIFNLRPPQPRYAEIWDVSIVFRFIDEWGHNEHLSLRQLNIKTATILLLLKGERINTLSSNKHPLIKRFIKGIFNLRPPQPRYAEIWDVSIFFRFIDEWGHNEHLSLKQLTMKTATILLLLSGERINTLS